MILFQDILCEGIQADKITMTILSTTCGRIRGIEYARLIHDYILKVGIEGELNQEKALLDMYAKVLR